MEIRNYDEIVKIEENKSIELNPFAPKHPFRMIIIGGSGQGKTNLLLNLLTEYVYYDCIYLYAKTADSEDKYIWLREYIENIEETAKEKMMSELVQEVTDDIQIIKAWDTTLDDLISVDDLNSSKQNLMIFDDMTLEDKNAHEKISEHYIRGRKKNCSYIYIGHSYFRLPKIIRNNVTDIILFPPDNKRESIELAKTYANRITFREFQELLNTVRNDNDGHDFIYIDTRAKDLRLWIRQGFDYLYCGI